MVDNTGRIRAIIAQMKQVTDYSECDSDKAEMLRQLRILAKDLVALTEKK
jgi:hypothetical protein